MEWMTRPDAWIALATLTSLEIVLGIDNIVFLSIVTGRLPKAQRPRARFVGLALAMIFRILLLLSLAWIIRLTAPLFTMVGNEISGRDLILIGGGLFLLAKSTHEIHHKLEGASESAEARPALTMRSAMVQVILLDLVFSLDSVITAVGMARDVEVMILAIVLAVIFMMVFAGPISRFVEQHPTVKMLALAFLLLVGVALVADGLDTHIPRGYIYFAMSFSVFVEMLNLKLRSQARQPVKLRGPAAPVE